MSRLGSCFSDVDFETPVIRRKVIPYYPGDGAILAANEPRSDEVRHELKDLKDFLDLAVAVFRDYPVAALMLLAAGFLAGLWHRGSVDAGEIRGLKAEINGLDKGLNGEIRGLRQQLAVRDERVQALKENEEALTRAVEQLTASNNRLQSEIEARADPKLSATAASTAQAIKQIATANTELRDTLDRLVRITPITQRSD